MFPTLVAGVDVDVEGVRRVLPLPKSFNAVKAEVREEFKGLYAVEPPSWYEELHWVCDKFFWEAKEFGILGAGGCCWAGGQWVHDELNKVTYQFWQYALGTIAGSMVYVWREGGPREDALEIKEWGRAGGPHGWDKYGFVIAGVLTMPKLSNLGGILSLYSDPPSLPFRRTWKVPVFPSEVPRLPCPMSALFRYRLPVPLPVPLLTVVADVAVESPEPREAYIALWDTGRRKIAERAIRLSGSEQYKITASFTGMLPSSGFIEVSDNNYTLGSFTISNVYTFPPST